MICDTMKYERRMDMSFYDFEAINVLGDKVSMKKYEGKVLLVVNSATECGFTPQYDDLQDLYEKYQTEGFEILEFPCNQFGNQAPGTDEDIAGFCDTKFGLTFSRFSKIDVNGEDALPLYKFLKKEKTFEGFDQEHELASTLDRILGESFPDYKNTSDIKWNFTKFLIDRNGNVIERFEPTKDMLIVESKIKELL